MSLLIEDQGIDIDNFDKEAEIAKFDGLEALGWKIIVRVYTPPEKIGSIILSSQTREEYQYRECTGLVVKMAEDAYKDARYKRPWCSVGDWVVFARHAGYKTSYNKIPIFMLNDDCIDGKVDDPRRVGR